LQVDRRSPRVRKGRVHVGDASLHGDGSPHLLNREGREFL
jgi:hypothetical protein